MITNNTLRRKIAEMPRLKSATAYKILLTLINEIIDNGGQAILTKTTLANKVGIRQQHINRDLNPLINANLIAIEEAQGHAVKCKYSLGTYFDSV